MFVWFGFLYGFAYGFEIDCFMGLLLKLLVCVIHFSECFIKLLKIFHYLFITVFKTINVAQTETILVS